MAGRLDQAYAALAEGRPEDVAQHGAVRARVAATLLRRVDSGRFAGDTAGGGPSACCRQDTPPPRNAGWACYLLSSASYQRNDLTSAEAHARAVAGMRYAGRPMIYLQSAFIYAWICQARSV